MVLKNTLIYTSGLMLWATNFINAQVLEKQVLKKSAFSRFYVGAGGLFFRYRTPSDHNSFYSQADISPFVTAGYQFSPKLGVQIGWARGGYSNQDAGEAYDRATGTTTGTFFNEYYRHITVIPVLFRYATARNLQRRIQLDLLGGITVVRSSYRNTQTLFDKNNTLVSQDLQGGQANPLILTLGLGVRARLSKHLDFVGDGALNHTLSGKSVGGLDIQPSLSANLRYRFWYH